MSISRRGELGMGLLDYCVLVCLLVLASFMALWYLGMQVRKKDCMAGVAAIASTEFPGEKIEDVLRHTRLDMSDGKCYTTRGHRPPEVWVTGF